MPTEGQGLSRSQREPSLEVQELETGESEEDPVCEGAEEGRSIQKGSSSHAATRARSDARGLFKNVPGRVKGAKCILFYISTGSRMTKSLFSQTAFPTAF